MTHLEMAPEAPRKRRRVTVFAVTGRPRGIGPPPAIHADLACRYSYFDTYLGEQFLLTFTPTTGRFVLFGGELGWKKAWDVEDGMVPGVNLDPYVARWVRLCWEEWMQTDSARVSPSFWRRMWNLMWGI